MKVKCTKCGEMVDPSDLAKRGGESGTYRFCKLCYNIDGSEDRYIKGLQGYVPCGQVRAEAMAMTEKKYKKIFDKCEKQGIVLTGKQRRGKNAIACETVDMIMKG